MPIIKSVDISTGNTDERNMSHTELQEYQMRIAVAASARNSENILGSPTKGFNGPTGKELFHGNR